MCDEVESSYCSLQNLTQSKALKPSSEWIEEPRATEGAESSPDLRKQNTNKLGKAKVQESKEQLKAKTSTTKNQIRKMKGKATTQI